MKPKNPKSPKAEDVPMGSGLLDKARQALMERRRKVEEYLDKAGGKKEEK